MNKVVQDLSGPVLADAIDDNFWEVFKLLRHSSQVELYVGPDIHWALTDIPLALFNATGRANLAPDAVDPAINAAIRRGRSRNVPIMWRINLGTRQTDVRTQLKQHGFIHAGNGPGMAADLLALNQGLPKPRGLVIERVADAETLAQFCHTALVGFEFPASMEDAFLELWASVGVGPRLPVQHYLGWLDGDPVATSSLILGAGVVGVYIVATVPEARRKGIGAAMSLVPCREARELGFRVAVLEASEMGYGVYQKIGFRECCRTGNYLWKPEKA